MNPMNVLRAVEIMRPVEESGLPANPKPFDADDLAPGEVSWAIGTVPLRALMETRLRTGATILICDGEQVVGQVDERAILEGVLGTHRNT
jgi:hypothetical protein